MSARRGGGGLTFFCFRTEMPTKYKKWPLRVGACSPPVFLRAARVQNETAPEKMFKSIRKTV